MRLCFNARFHTDGDYGFRKDIVDSMFDINDSLYEKANITFSYDQDGGDIYIRLVVEGEGSDCRLVLRDLLEALICSITTNKYWLVKDLYNLLHYFLEDLWDNKYKVSWLDGNYEGTMLTLRKMEE